MEIWIKHNNLIDFPYTPGSAAGDSIFTFDEQKITNLVSEIMLASPTCYLVSGYRGSGKTSFIRRVQEGCLAAADKDQNGQKGVLFVYSSFSRFESKTYFLRKLIRDLHEAATGWESKKDKPVNQSLSELYKKTFEEIKRERSKGNEVATSVELSLDLTDFLKKLALAFLPLLGPLIYDLLLKPAVQVAIASFFPFIRLLIDLTAAIWVVFNTIKITNKYSIKQSNADKITTTSLSDDEITEYDLERVLDAFYSRQYKIVFVLDELDKIEDGELDQLLREMKPWLVKGKADFILVAGQRLTMKYYSLRERDDELLTSLFSKIIHISPLTEQQLFRIFKDFLVFGIVNSNQQPEQRPLEEFSEEHKKLAVSIGNSLIYRSRRLPRTFINLIRQELQWRNGQAFLPVPNDDFRLEEIKMKILRKLFEKLALNAEVSETGKSHIIMQLFRAASVIRDRRTPELQFSRLWDEIINPEKISGRVLYPYPDIGSVLRSCVEEFYQEAIKEEIVVPVKNEGLSDNLDNWREGAGEEEYPIDFSVSQTPGKEALTPFDEDYHFKSFIGDFDTFLRLLESLAKDLLPLNKENIDNATIDQLLSAYVTAEVLQTPMESSVVLRKPIGYYRSRLGQPQAFKDVFDLFSASNLSFNALFTQLFRAFTEKKLREKFLEVATVLQETSEARSHGQYAIADYFATVPISSQTVEVLIDFSYIDGEVTIPAEETQRAVALLDEYNIITSKGNYYISIIFFKVNRGWDEHALSTSARYQIEKTRPDLAGRVNYFILSILNFEQLGSLLSEAVKSLSPYSLIPVLDENKAAWMRLARLSDTSAINPEDTQKGKWGLKPIDNNRQLTALVQSAERTDRFVVYLKVQPLMTDQPLTGKVTFHLPNAFQPDQFTVFSKNGIAELPNLICSGPFTVGVSCDNNTTQLELDLTNLPDSPPNFNISKKGKNMPMGGAYIEHRPHAASEHAPTSHYVIVVNGIEINGPFSTQRAAKNAACEKGYRPVHVARTRHLQDRSQPAHWRVDPC